MAHGLSLEVRGLTKTFGQVRAVEDLSFTVEPGRVTGFLGPNGAGKTTTLRCLLGLVTPTTGTATIGGRHYSELDSPSRTVGAVLEAASFHPGRTARDHLRVLTAGSGLPDSRADTVLGQIGLAEFADRRVGGFSLGMRQRLGMAGALLGDPDVLVLDEPGNGLDPAGIAWLRQFLRGLAAEGRTVLISSHALGEVQQTVDDVVVIARGRLVRAGTLAEIESGPRPVTIASPDLPRLAAALPADAVLELADGRMQVRGRTAEEIGHLAHQLGVELHELSTAPSDLEQVFLQMTGEVG